MGIAQLGQNARLVREAFVLFDSGDLENDLSARPMGQVHPAGRASGDTLAQGVRAKRFHTLGGGVSQKFVSNRFD
jgi:hypothetical protein